MSLVHKKNIYFRLLFSINFSCILPKVLVYLRWGLFKKKHISMYNSNPYHHKCNQLQYFWFPSITISFLVSFRWTLRTAVASREYIQLLSYYYYCCRNQSGQCTAMLILWCMSSLSYTVWSPWGYILSCRTGNVQQQLYYLLWRTELATIEDCRIGTDSGCIGCRQARMKVQMWKWHRKRPSRHTWFYER